MTGGGKRKLFVGGLPSDCDEKALGNAFSNWETEDGNTFCRFRQVNLNICRSLIDKNGKNCCLKFRRLLFVKNTSLSMSKFVPIVMPLFLYCVVIVVYDRETRRSRNFGYVTFMDERDAADAMKQMGGESGKGKVLHIS